MDDMVGHTLGPYQVVEQLGAGTMATVYKGYHPTMERYVAIKVLPDRLGRDSTFRARFLREARTIARLEHRYILPTYIRFWRGSWHSLSGNALCYRWHTGRFN
jgi:eukaryotic-like serine/threonine-protein kinase